MRRSATRSAFALTTAGLLVLGIAGCSEQSAPEQEGGGQSNLKIVEQVQIDQAGAEVPAGNTGTPADPAGDGQARCEPVSIAMAGALTGPDAALGINIERGARLAIDKHNAANPNCQVNLQTFDTQGNEQTASGIAPRIINDASIRALIGPAFSGETEATGKQFSDAGLVSTTASATRVSLSENGWRTFFRGLANDGVQGPAVANYLKNNLKYSKVCVIDDSTAYGTGLAETLRTTLGPAADAGCSGQIKKGEKDFSATVNKVSGASPDAVFFSGYYSEAAPLVQQLRDGGVTATFVSADGTKDQQFVDQAGDSSKDALLSCPCGPAPADFAKEYSEKFDGAEPGTYSTEGYDLATILLKGIDAGKVARPDLLEHVRTYNAPGVARNYQWTPNGELTTNLIWIYKVQS